jgi:hypothetical protein
MTEPRGKSNKQKWEDAITLLTEEQAKYDLMPKKELKTAINKLAKIEAITESISTLAEKKDEVYLSRSCRSQLVKTYVLSKYNRQKEVSTIQMRKGILVEDDSIEMMNGILGTKYVKNTKRLENPWLTGCLDVHNGIGGPETATEIIDMKNSFDIENFFTHVYSEMNMTEFWQLHGYLFLCGEQAVVGNIAHTLMTFPQIMIDDEKRRLVFNMGVATDENPEYKKAAAKLEYNMTFDDIPPEQRLIMLTVDRDQSAIDKIAPKVDACRIFLNEFAERHEWFTKHHRKHSFLSAVEDIIEDSE